MKHQQVSVDYWTMGKAMVTYGVLTAMVWLMLRLFNAIFTLPRRMRDQQDNIQNSLKELQKRYPELNVTEEELRNAEKEYEELIKGEEEKDKQKPSENTEETKEIEDKKTI